MALLTIVHVCLNGWKAATNVVSKCQGSVQTCLRCKALSVSMLRNVMATLLTVHQCKQSCIITPSILGLFLTAKGCMSYCCLKLLQVLESLLALCGLHCGVPKLSFPITHYLTKLCLHVWQSKRTRCMLRMAGTKGTPGKSKQCSLSISHVRSDQRCMQCFLQRRKRRKGWASL